MKDGFVCLEWFGEKLNIMVDKIDEILKIIFEDW